MRIREFAGWVLAAVIAVAASSAAAQQDEGPVLKPKAKPKPSSATILVVCDLDCTWTLDGYATGSLAAGNSKKVAVSLGQHLLDAATTDGHDKAEREIEVKTATQTIVRFALQPVRDARLKSEQAARDQAAREQEARDQAALAAAERQRQEVARKQQQQGGSCDGCYEATVKRQEVAREQQAAAEQQSQLAAADQQTLARRNLLKRGGLVPGTEWKFEQIGMLEGPGNWSPSADNDNLWSPEAPGTTRGFGTNARYLFWVFEVNPKKTAGARSIDCAYRLAGDRAISAMSPMTLTTKGGEKGTVAWSEGWGSESSGYWSPGDYRLTCAMDGITVIDAPFHVEDASVFNLERRKEAGKFDKVTGAPWPDFYPGALRITRTGIQWTEKGSKGNFDAPCGTFQARGGRFSNSFQIVRGSDVGEFLVWYSDDQNPAEIQRVFAAVVAACGG